MKRIDGVGGQTAELDPVRREAVAWVQRLASGRATAADAAALRQWRARSAAHEAAFAEARRIWADIAPAGRGLRGRGAAAAPAIPPARASRGPGRRAFLTGGLAGAAAAAAGLAVVNPPLGLWPSLAEMSADFSTGTGEQREVSVADGVAVRLNTQTSIAVQPAPEEDRIELIAGEASFAARRERALVVLAAGGRTVASAARFDVRHVRDGTGMAVCVTCLEGGVGIEHRGRTAALGPGQQLRYGEAGLGRMVAIDPDIASAWQRGIVVFRSTPLAQVVEEINRYRPGRIILVNAELGRQPVSGRFRTDRMDDILLRLEQAFGATLRNLPGGIVLMS